MTLPSADSRLRLPFGSWLSASLRSLWAIRSLDAWKRDFSGHRIIPADFFGLCVATGSDPAIDDYLVERLRFLKIRNVRMDYSLPETQPHESRLLDRLLAEGFRIGLHPVSVGGMRAASPARRRQALETLLDQVGSRLELLELGTTVNRRKWSGCPPSTFLSEYVSAFQTATRRGIALAAPNVTDFEPVYNAVLLDAMRRLKCLPRYQSNNLFVERAGEPEQFDHKIMGRRAAPYLKFDLLRKARFLNAIGRWAGVAETISSHAAWSLRRIARFAGAIEQKQADYVSRYCALAAVSGALRRVYWGPLIGQREGLVDDGSDYYPDTIPHAACYTLVPGRPADYRLRPAFAAFQTVVSQIQETEFIRAVHSGPELFVLEFRRPDGCRLHMTWTRDGRRAITSDIYPSSTLPQATILDRDGRRLPAAPSTLSESPIYLLWPGKTEPKTGKVTALFSGIRFEQGNGYQPLKPHGWFGVVATARNGPPIPVELADPSLWLPPAGGDMYLRNARNRVWIQTLPWMPEKRVVIKKFGKPRGLFRLLQGYRPSRARRAWNAAVELLRRGLPTPAPKAFLERTTRHPARRTSYYICEVADTAYSVRSFFSAYTDRKPAPADIAPEIFFGRLAAFLNIMHRKGVFFRDLSAGNILVSSAGSNTQPSSTLFTLIDVTRARFYPTPLDVRRRLCDLMRVCHPLDDGLRRRFLKVYLQAAGLPLRFWMQWPFIYYNSKHRIKKLLRRRR